MPDPYERHGRDKWEWGTSGPRSQQRAAAADDEKLPKVPGKKDPSACKQNHWGPHEPELILVPYGSRPKCGWYPSYAHRGEFVPRWDCLHQEHCRHCGKVLRDRLKAAECPDQTSEIPESAYEECEKWTRRWDRYRPAPRTEKPRTGYRKPKADGAG